MEKRRERDKHRETDSERERQTGREGERKTERGEVCRVEMLLTVLRGRFSHRKVVPIKKRLTQLLSSE